jgi:hypothetical protein
MERTEIAPFILTQSAQDEKNHEKAADFLIAKLATHSVIIRKGTTFLIIFSILAFYAAMYLIHMETVDRRFQSPVVKTAVR